MNHLKSKESKKIFLTFIDDETSVTWKTDENNKEVGIEIPELEELTFENGDDGVDDVHSKVKGMKHISIKLMFFIFL